jgi:signal transduction protein with GAF and PtsI domain
MRMVTVLAFLVMFFSVFGMFFIFDHLNKIAEECQKGGLDVTVCKSFTGFGMNVIMVLLIIAGFVLVISSTFFIMIR